MSKKSLQTPSKIILGIDPGYDRIGIAVLEKTPNNKDKILHSSCLQTSAKEDIYSRFLKIGEVVNQVITKYKPTDLAIENLFLANNQKTAMRVSEARGIIIYEAIKNGLKVYEYTPMQVKVAVTGDGSSDKLRIIKMLGLLVELPKRKTIDDEYDAIAVALTHAAIKK